MTQRGLDTTSFTERGALGAITYTARTLTNTTFTPRTGITQTPVEPPWIATDDAPPVISNVHCNALLANAIELDWDTDEPSNCTVRYSTVTAMSTYTQGPTHEHYVTNNRVYSLTGLTPDTNYYFRIIVEDENGNNAVGAKLYTFKTADTGKPGTPPQEAVS